MSPASPAQFAGGRHLMLITCAMLNLEDSDSKSAMNSPCRSAPHSVSCKLTDDAISHRVADPRTPEGGRS
jgi:hypothetical protein